MPMPSQRQIVSRVAYAKQSGLGKFGTASTGRSASTGGSASTGDLGIDCSAGQPSQPKAVPPIGLEQCEQFNAIRQCQPTANRQSISQRLASLRSPKQTTAPDFTTPHTDWVAPQRAMRTRRDLLVLNPAYRSPSQLLSRIARGFEAKLPIESTIPLE